MSDSNERDLGKPAAGKEYELDWPGDSDTFTIKVHDVTIVIRAREGEPFPRVGDERTVR